MQAIKRAIHRFRFPWLYKDQNQDPRHVQYEHVQVHVDYDEDEFEDELPEKKPLKKETPSAPLMVDLIETAENFVVQAVIAGCQPSKIDVTISRHLVIIHGERHPHNRIQRGDYLVSELQWGKFHRSVELPDEIDVATADASEENGILTIRLPKFDKHRQAKLHVRSNL